MPTNSFVFWHGMALFTFHLLLLCICSSWRFEWIVRNRAIEPLIHICRHLGWLHLHTYCTGNVVYFVFQPAEDIEMGCSSARYAQMKCVCVCVVCLSHMHITNCACGNSRRIEMILPHIWIPPRIHIFHYSGRKENNISLLLISRRCR